MRHILLACLLLALASCGKDDSSETCKEKAEVDNLVLESKENESSVFLTASVTLRDECPNEPYQQFFTLQEDSAAPDCTSGRTTLTIRSNTWYDLKYSATYFVRVCVTRSGYTSPGIVKSIVIGPKPTE